MAADEQVGWVVSDDAVSPFLYPVICGVKVGFGSPYGRDVVGPVTVSSAGVIVSFPFA